MISNGIYWVNKWMNKIQFTYDSPTFTSLSCIYFLHTVVYAMHLYSYITVLKYFTEHYDVQLFSVILLQLVVHD